MDKLLNTDQAAELLSVKPSTIRKWVHYGFIPHVKIGSCVRFVERDIEAWVQQRSSEGRISLCPEVRGK